MLVTTATLLVAACGEDGGPTADADPARPPTSVDPTTTTTTEPEEPPGTYGASVAQVIPFSIERLSPDEPPGPLFVDYGAGSLWVSHHRTHTVSRVDPQSGEIVATIAIDPAPGSTSATDPAASGPATGGGCVLATDDAVWVLDSSGFAWKIDPDTNRIAARVDLPGLIAEGGLARRDGVLWAGTATGWVRIDDTTGTADGPFPAPAGMGPGAGVVAAPGAVWLGSSQGAVRVNPATAAVEAVVGPAGLGFGPVGFAAGLVWGVGAHAIWALDPATNEVVHSFDAPAAVDTLRADSATVTDDALWVVAGPADRGRSHPEARQHLVRFDLATGDAESVDLVNAEVGFIMGLTVAEGSVWAADMARGNLLRIDGDADERGAS